MGAVSFSLDINLVDSIRSVLPVPVFFETGTFKGDTVDAMQSRFRRLITVELSEPLWKDVSSRFSGNGKIEVHLGDSSEFLAKLCPEFVESSVFYWLDAHWCVANDTSGEKSQCPLLEEIRAIGKLNEESIIVIDDARLFLCCPPAPHESSQWPTFDSIVTALRSISSKHELAVVNDVIVFFPRSARDAVAEYARKHGVDWLRAQQSYLENGELRRSLDEKQIELDNIYLCAEERLSQLRENLNSSRALTRAIEEKEAALVSLTRSLEEKKMALRELTCALVAKEAVISELTLFVDSYRSGSSITGQGSAK